MVGILSTIAFERVHVVVWGYGSGKREILSDGAGERASSISFRLVRNLFLVYF
jgi:hypothetical protein